MTQKKYFIKTFLYVFTFFIVFKFVTLLLNGFEGLDLKYILKNLLAAFLTSLILGVINYFAKIDFFQKK